MKTAFNIFILVLVLAVTIGCPATESGGAENAVPPSPPSEEISGSGWPPSPGDPEGGWPMDAEWEPIPYEELEKMDYSSFSSPSK